MRTLQGSAILALIALLTTVHLAYADDEDGNSGSGSKPARRPAMMQRGSQYSSDDSEDSGETHHPKGYGLGISVQGYYDPVSSYLKMETTAATGVFGSQSGAGFGGMQFMVSYTNNYNFEFSTGFDYLFPVNAQGQQVVTGSFAVNSQSISILGLKLVQVGYKIPFNHFTLVPYGGLGLYLGKNVINLTTGVGLVDTVTYSKTSFTFTAGLRGDLALNDSFSLNFALEGFVPYDYATQLTQSGTSASEMPGYESELQAQMGFMGSFGFRILGGAKVSF